MLISFEIKSRDEDCLVGSCSILPARTTGASEPASRQDVVVDPDPDPPSQASQHRQDGREYGTKVRDETKTVASDP